MKEQTAMQELISYLKTDNDPPIELRVAIKKATELLTKEREQIEQAYDAGVRTNYGIQTADFKHGKKYFSTTYKQPL